jgi:hypothetical protein
MSNKAKQIIEKVKKDLDKEKTGEIKKEFHQRALESKENELKYNASEYFTKKLIYIFDDLEDFKLEINKVSKGVYFNIKNDKKTLLDPENSYPGELKIAEILFWTPGARNEAKNLWRLSIEFEGLYTENSKLKVDQNNISKLVKPKNFKIYKTYQEGWSWEDGNYTKENTYPIERYDAFFEKYVAEITRYVSDNKDNIIIKKDIIKKKKKFFIF